jgi:hypothetical protein
MKTGPKIKKTNVYYSINSYTAAIGIHRKGKEYLCFIDFEDLKRVREHHWNLSSVKYPRARIDGKQIYLHNLLLPLEKGLEVDHINKDRLDNRKINLRMTTKAGNHWNKLSPGSHHFIFKDGKSWVVKVPCSDSGYLQRGPFKSDSLAKEWMISNREWLKTQSGLTGRLFSNEILTVTRIA